MKKRLLLLPILTLSMFLSSCEKEKVQLTYGTYIDQTIFTLKELDTAELHNRLYNENETLLLATYHGEKSEGCLCWTTFENVVARYMNTYHEQVYIYNVENVDDSLQGLHIDSSDDGRPDLYIFQGTKRITRFCYPKMQDHKIFEDLTGEYMYNKVHEYIKSPSMYYVSEDYLDSKIGEKKDNLAVLFMRNGCGDCQYVIPNVIIPYISTNALTRKILIYDLQDAYDLSKKETATEEEKAIYQIIKNKYGLSESANEKFGYHNGVVPTFQYYEKGELKDATIYFNDVVSKKDDGTFYIFDSFYSEERVKKLSYLTYCSFQTVLKGMTISEGVLQTKTGDYYWAQEEAAKYHTPILKAFLEYYCSGVTIADNS